MQKKKELKQLVEKQAAECQKLLEENALLKEKANTHEKAMQTQKEMESKKQLKNLEWQQKFQGLAPKLQANEAALLALQESLSRQSIHPPQKNYLEARLEEAQATITELRAQVSHLFEVIRRYQMGFQ